MMNADLNGNKYYSVEEINSRARANPAGFLLECDSAFAERVKSAVDSVLKRSPDGGVIMLSGPSSAGKTTTSMMLMRILGDMGKGALKISLDDFFLPADETPLADDGRRDFEGIAALDLEELRRCMNILLTAGECLMPRYDFTLRRPRKDRRRVVLPKSGYIIIEGLHAINPALTAGIGGSVTKIFLDAAGGLKIGGKSLNGRTMRMFRRLVRDTSYRSVNAVQCLELCESVVRGEERNIKPFAAGNDIIIDSFHMCEPCIIGARAIELLKDISPDSRFYDTAAELRALMAEVEVIDGSLLDDDSLLTEFVGGGSYRY